MYYLQASVLSLQRERKILAHLTVTGLDNAVVCHGLSKVISSKYLKEGAYIDCRQEGRYYYHFNTKALFYLQRWSEIAFYFSKRKPKVISYLWCGGRPIIDVFHILNIPDILDIRRHPPAIIGRSIWGENKTLNWQKIIFFVR